MSGLLSSDGKTSSTRVQMFICTLTGCGIAIMYVWRGGEDLMGLSALVTGIIGCGVVNKAVQKGRE